MTGGEVRVAVPVVFLVLPVTVFFGKSVDRARDVIGSIVEGASVTTLG